MPEPPCSVVFQCSGVDGAHTLLDFSIAFGVGIQDDPGTSSACSECL